MVEEVATALLDASRRMSMSDASSVSDSGASTGRGWGSSWGNSTNELEDKTGSLPKQMGSWFSGVPKRNRALSESEGMASPGVGLNMMAWLTGYNNRSTGFTDPAINNPPSDATNNRRVRRSSSKDVEEAMAGGFNKAGIYMPPF